MKGLQFNFMVIVVGTIIAVAVMLLVLRGNVPWLEKILPAWMLGSNPFA